jgi:glutathione peroxidase-family protein
MEITYPTLGSLRAGHGCAYCERRKVSKKEALDWARKSKIKPLESYVNVASKCGHTPQYAKLEALYEKFKDKLVIIGFPCNQFLGQEPGSEKEIAEFCTKNYGVTFPLSSKIDVKGKDQHPVYTWLMTKDINGVSDDKVEWNFHKVLVSPEGAWLKGFSAGSDPMEIAEAIQ